MSVNLKKYQESMIKKNCPNDCTFSLAKLRHIELAIVPPPEEIVGIIISRDPTVAWHYFYEFSKREKLRRNFLFVSAIPLAFLTKISIFMDDMINKENNITKDDRQLLFEVILNKTYWTHLHKCFTNTKFNYSKFNNSNAKKCANTWLKDELDKAIGLKTRFLITLGNDVENWINSWKELRDIEVIDFIHPSNQNNRYWYRSSKEKPIFEIIQKTERNLIRLIEICRTINK